MPVRLFAHQRQAVQKALTVMGGRVLLADEVGLGKTVEAGAILKELWLRGLVRRALVLVPAALVAQWKQELWRLCAVRACVHPCGHGWGREEEVALASLEYARIPRHARAIQAWPWDLVIVDEAHRLKNHASAGFRLLCGLRKTFLVLVTATPVHNDLVELHSLVSLLRPGQLGTRRAFLREFTDGPRTPRNAEGLRQLLASVVVRTRRHEAGVRLPDRRVVTVPVRLQTCEAALYREVGRLLRQAAGEPGLQAAVLALTVLLREAASSPLACAATLHRLCRCSGSEPWALLQPRLGELAGQALELARRRAGPKIRWLVRWLRRRALDEGLVAGQLVAFTEFATTARHALRWLARCGIDARLFTGAMSGPKRQAALEAFLRTTPVLVSTDAGSEGLNLQFCREVVNLDLPWNPMRLEQRIGRVHRLGQTGTVRIVNLAARDTIEEYVLVLIHEKLGMFREVVGDLDAVVAAVPGGMQRWVARLAATCGTDRELQDALERLGEGMARRARAWARARTLTEAALDGRPHGLP